MTPEDESNGVNWLGLLVLVVGVFLFVAYLLKGGF